MLLRAPGDSQDGITLMEVLLVVFIIALGSSVAVMTLPARKDELTAARERLQATLVQVQDRAILTGERFGLQRDGAGWQLSVWRGDEWQPARALSFELPDGAGLAIEPQTDRQLNLPEDWPVIQFDPLGATTRAQLTLFAGRDEQAFDLAADGGLVAYDPR